METTDNIGENERSIGLDLIVQANFIVNSNDLAIKYIGGENTVFSDSNHMFPDVLLYGDSEKKHILQGWELKMPDVPIEDETNIKNAKDKANILGVNSFLLWNFTYAVLYEKGEDGDFSIIKQWSDTSYIQTRDDVVTYKQDWFDLLETVLLEISQYFVSGEFVEANIEDVVSKLAVDSIIDRNKLNVAEELKNNAVRNTVIDAYIQNWWHEISSEYQYDETDPYCAYAKTVLLDWSNRIIFAHLIKRRQNGAMLVNDINENTTPDEANALFDEITKRSDFYNIFAGLKYNEMLPNSAWSDLVSFSLFLKDNGIDSLDQEVLQRILENSVNESKRCINGQYTTPKVLADILVRLTVRDWTKSFIDCCCGTGTIAKAALLNKKNATSTQNAVNTTWASDKNKFPLQIANISMADSDTINIPLRIFQHNALNLQCGENIQVIDPETGEPISLELPEFSYIATNLPFVKERLISSEDADLINSAECLKDLSRRSDLSYYIAIKISDILEQNGMLGIIVSNSWMGTDAGHKFIEVLNTLYSIKQIHISGKGRWFQNADIITTLMILQKKAHTTDDKTNFFLWKSSLSDIEQDSNIKETIINSGLLEEEIDPDIVELSQYSEEEIKQFAGYNISYNALFHKVDWLTDVFSNLIRIDNVYHVIRGCRRGANSMFYPHRGEHHIESIFIKHLLKDAKGINTYDIVADTAATGQAFCCSLSENELISRGYTGALQWIAKFKGQNNKVGVPLPEALSKGNTYSYWYELQPDTVANIVTSINPDQRFFFSRLNEPTFIDQRLVGLSETPEYPDYELNHALLNSIITLFYLEAVGFGRGLGVLDINKTTISRCYMPDPSRFTQEQRDNVVEKFNVLKQRPFGNIDDELERADRIDFDVEILKSLGLEQYYESIKRSFLSMKKTRTAGSMKKTRTNASST